MIFHQREINVDKGNSLLFEREREKKNDFKFLTVNVVSSSTEIQKLSDTKDLSKQDCSFRISTHPALSIYRTIKHGSIKSGGNGGGAADFLFLGIF